MARIRSKMRVKGKAKSFLSSMKSWFVSRPKFVDLLKKKKTRRKSTKRKTKKPVTRKKSTKRRKKKSRKKR